MISDWEVWACAQQQITQHGSRAPEKIAERLGAMALAGDAEGLATWQRIAAAAAQLTDYKAAARTRH